MRPHQFDVSFGVQEQVFRLEVPVYDALSMEVAESFYYTARVEPRGAVIKRGPAQTNTIIGFWLLYWNYGCIIAHVLLWHACCTILS